MKTKMLPGVLGVLLGTMLSVAAAAPVPSPSTAPVRAAGDYVWSETSNAFALDLYAQLRGQEGNLFVSPYSISTALAMTWAGARGETAAQMAKTLHFALPPEQIHSAMAKLIERYNAGGSERGYELTVANALWGQQGYPFLDSYLAATERWYGARLHQVDFQKTAEAARETINQWVAEKTRGKITNLIPPGLLDSSTRLVLTNAIYFKGQWAHPFKKETTAPTSFTLLDGTRHDVPMMQQTDQFRLTISDDVLVLEMPYAVKQQQAGPGVIPTPRLAMDIILPKALDGLPAVEKNLTTAQLNGWLTGLRPMKVVVAVPTFKTTSTFSLAEMLRAMGMADAFNAGKADFSGMDGNRDLFLSAVVHKAYADVNEEGTEAAAATGAVMSLTAMPVEEKLPVFCADHPFLFLIRDIDSGSILFMGRMMDPSK